MKKETKQKNKQNKTRKYKNGGWSFVRNDTDPYVYKLMTKKRAINRPINPGKNISIITPSSKTTFDVINQPNTNEFDTETETEPVLEKTYYTTPSFESTCKNTNNECDLNTITLPPEQKCSWFGDNTLLVGLYALKQPDQKDNEIIIIRPDTSKTPMGDLTCDLLKQKLVKLYETISLYKNCPSFANIDTIKIYKHSFKQIHLSLITLSFSKFPKIRKFILGVDPLDFDLTEQDKSCLEQKYNIKIEINPTGEYGMEIIATRLHGGKKYTKKHRSNKSI